MPELLDRDAPTFGASTLARVVDVTVTLTGQLLADWERAAGRGDPVDVLDDMQDLAMRVMGMVLFSRDVRNDLLAGGPDAARAPANCFIETARSAAEVATRRRLSPTLLPPWLPGGPHRRFRRGIAAVDRFVYGRIDERLADPDGYDDILADLIRGYGGLAAATAMDPRRELRDQAVTLFFAGFETTAAALTATWQLLGDDPAAEARFHRELDDVLGGRAPVMDDLKALGYTGQLVRESIRTHPPVYSLTREAAPSDEIDGLADRRRGAVFADAEIVAVLAVAGQHVRLRPLTGDPVPAGAANAPLPASGLPMRVEPRR
jgi:cytochrome P450